MRRSTMILFAIMAIVLPSCFKELSDKVSDIGDITWSPNLAVPLTNGSVTIAEFTEDLSGENFGTTATDDGLVVFKYSNNDLFSTTAEDLVQINDENESSELKPDLSTIPDISIPLTGTFIYEQKHSFTGSTPEGDKLYNLSLKGGTLDMSIIGDFPASGELLITFDCLTKDGVSPEILFQWNDDGTGAQNFERTIDLEGLEIDYTDNGTTFNNFSYTTLLTLNLNNQIISSTNKLDFNLGVNSLKFSKSLLTVGTRSITVEFNTVILNTIKELKRGVYFFDEPSISFNFRNSFGLPVEIAVNSFVAHSDRNGNLALTGDFASTPQSIGYPSIDEIGETVHTNLTINHLNSNIPQILAFQPDSIVYSFDGIVNAQGNDDTHFLLDTSRIYTGVELELPMIGRFRNLTYVERYDFDGSMVEELESALFRLTSTNGFPINADVQVYFLSDTGALIDSLIYDDRRLLAAGLTDNNGKVNEPTTKIIEVVVQNERLTSISNATSMRLRATLDTPENDTRSVRIYEDDELILNLFAQTEFDIVF
jgi:hypothetical protein